MDLHTVFMKQAIQLSDENVRAGGRPFGTVIVKDGKVLSTGQNLTHITQDPTDHGEIVAVRKACQILKSPVLTGCTVYAIAHPCPMCMSALLLAKPDKIYFCSTLEEKAANGLGASGALYGELVKHYDHRSVAMERVEKLAPDAIDVYKLFQKMSAQK